MTARVAYGRRNGCGHPDDSCGYVLWHARAAVRQRAGQRQTRCPRCKLWRWPGRWTKDLQARLVRSENLAAQRDARRWAAALAATGRPPRLVVRRGQRCA